MFSIPRNQASSLLGCKCAQMLYIRMICLYSLWFCFQTTNHDPPLPLELFVPVVVGPALLLICCIFCCIKCLCARHYAEEEDGTDCFSCCSSKCCKRCCSCSSPSCSGCCRSGNDRSTCDITRFSNKIFV